MKNQKKNGFREKLSDFRLLFNAVPTVPLVIFVLSLFSMNLFANKSIALPFDWLALDCGILVSWLVFLMLDILTKHFGPREATALSYFATLLHLCLCGVFFIVGMIPGDWGAAVGSLHGATVNAALNDTFGGTWFVIFGSAIAFLVSSTVNNFLHFLVGRAFFKDSRGIKAFVCSAYISTAVAQLADNFVFSMLVSRTFFDWSVSQCLTCSLFGMAAELVCEGIFVLFGYRILEKWRKNKVGEAYLCRKDQSARESV